MQEAHTRSTCTGLLPTCCNRHLSIDTLTALDSDATMLHITDDSCAVTTCYSTWLEKWRNHMKEALAAIKVPLSASHLHTPLVPSRLTQALTQHPNQSLVNYFLNGISSGF